MSIQVLTFEYEANGETQVLDCSPYIKRSGFSWTRNDLDSEKTVRLKNTKLRRDKLGVKRTLSIELINISRSELALLDDILSSPTYQARYLDLHGANRTGQFYTSSFTAILDESAPPENSEPYGGYRDIDQYGEYEQWSGAKFDMIEV